MTQSAEHEKEIDKYIGYHALQWNSLTEQKLFSLNIFQRSCSLQRSPVFCFWRQFKIMFFNQRLHICMFKIRRNHIQRQTDVDNGESQPTYDLFKTSFKKKNRGAAASWRNLRVKRITFTKTDSHGSSCLRTAEKGTETESRCMLNHPGK